MVPGFPALLCGFWGLNSGSYTFVPCTLQPELAASSPAHNRVIYLFIGIIFYREVLVALATVNLNAGVTRVCLAELTNLLLFAFSCLLIYTPRCLEQFQHMVGLTINTHKLNNSHVLEGCEYTWTQFSQVGTIISGSSEISLEDL